MPRKVNPKLVAGAAAGLAVAGAGGAVAAVKLTSPRENSQAIVNDAAKQLGIQPGKLSAALRQAFENRIDAAVAEGRLTKAQGEALKKRVESGELPLFGPGFGAPFGHAGHFAPFGRLDAAATYLGLSETELRSRLDSGKTLAEVATDEGQSVDGLVSALYDAAKKGLDDAVADGRLRKAQEDSILSGLRSRLEDFVNAQLRLDDGRRLDRWPRPGLGVPPPAGVGPGL